MNRRPLLNSGASADASLSFFSKLFYFFPRRSKSTSDIQADPAATRKAQMEELQKYREQVKEGDDKWQDVSTTDDTSRRRNAVGVTRERRVCGAGEATGGEQVVCCSRGCT